MGVKQSLRHLARRAGIEVTRYRPEGPPAAPAVEPPSPPELNADDLATLRLVRPYTMTSPERLQGLVKAVRYISRHRIPGAVVECGVWKGGSMMAAAKTLLAAGDGGRELYLYDTFEGMPPPTDADKDLNGDTAARLLETTSRDGPVWALARLDGVKQAMALTGYDPGRTHYVVGKVEDTIPATLPENIALLRLDTDWYESTRHELLHLYPRLATGGVVIIDDYGHWQGARKAVDEYLEQNNVRLLLNICDYTGRIGVKVD